MTHIPDTYENHGIFGVDLRKTGEQSLLCPSQECRGRRKSKLKTLRVNTTKQTWFCAHCGFTGGLKTHYTPAIPSNLTYTPVIPMPTIKPPDLPSELNTAHKKWLNEERGISDTTIAKFGITTRSNWLYEKGKYKAGNYNCVAFPYRRNGVLINIKFRGSGKRFSLVSQAELIAFNQDCLLDKPDYLVIVEGELDCMAVHQAGFPAVISPPNGANLNRNNLEWLDKIYDDVDSCSKIIIAVDNDEAGESLKMDLVRRFDLDKLWVVKWPEGCKDANDVLLNYGESKLRNFIESAEQIPIEGILEDNSLEEMCHRIYEHGYPKGLEIGWEQLNEHFKWLRGEFMVVTGIPSHGKSVWTEDAMIQLARFHDWKFGVWVAESDPEITAMNLLQKYTRQPIMGAGKMPRDIFEAGMQYVKQHFKFFNVTENSDNTLDKILDKGAELVKRYGIDCLYIDPWSYVEKKIGSLTDNQFFETCLPKIKLFRRRYNCMVIIVAHPRKMENDQKTGRPKVPGAYDIGGSNQWYGAPDKIISIYCNYAEDKTVDYHEIHILKNKKWWLGSKGMVEMKMDKLGVFHERNQLSGNPEQFDYKMAQAGENLEAKENYDNTTGGMEAPF